jgi:hypothetical protein
MTQPHSARHVDLNSYPRSWLVHLPFVRTPTGILDKRSRIIVTADQYQVHGSTYMFGSYKRIPNPNHCPIRYLHDRHKNVLNLGTVLHARSALVRQARICDAQQVFKDGK